MNRIIGGFIVIGLLASTPVSAQGTPSTGAEAQGTCKRLRVAALLFLGAAAAKAPGSLMLFQVVSIQPSERWTWDRQCRSHAVRCQGKLS